ncbi:MAG TPA: DUF2804 domain-containing protein [Propionibacteriaceae bacterium]|nr:DUF2804 domain-containing protein [Propionibacteriaceae bacterium]HBY22183.1 DUF2804 domain-containing protein [Propionibacteriaceae bacterium]
MAAREITSPVTLVGPNGLLNPDAVGWSRHPLHDTSGLKRGWRGRGRNKRWEYWLVTTPDLLVSLTVSDIDYAGVHTVWAYQRSTGRRIDVSAVLPLATRTTLPPSLGGSVAATASKGLAGRVEEVLGGTRLTAEAGGVRFDVLAGRLGAGESLGVVVPWSPRRFQYTVKDPLRPATGWIEFEGERHQLVPGESWAILDHGRGRWPYRMWWNWAAGAGDLADGRAIGLQFGGKWTDGTGAHENAVVVDGTLFPVHETLAWEYDPADWLAPWRLRSESVELELRPFWDHDAAMNLGIISSDAHQLFGHWYGSVRAGDERIDIDGVLGFAEDVRNRW